MDVMNRNTERAQNAVADALRIENESNQVDIEVQFDSEKGDGKVHSIPKEYVLLYVDEDEETLIHLLSLAREECLAHMAERFNGTNGMTLSPYRALMLQKYESIKEGAENQTEEQAQKPVRRTPGNNEGIKEVMEEAQATAPDQPPKEIESTRYHISLSVIEGHKGLGVPVNYSDVFEIRGKITSKTMGALMNLLSDNYNCHVNRITIISFQELTE
jgi:hypothetical protein